MDIKNLLKKVNEIRKTEKRQKLTVSYNKD
jgi:hypothetical protein